MKKANAALGLLAALLLLVHMGIQVYIYLSFQYLPVLSKVSALAFMAPVAVHVLLSIALLFFAPGGLKRDPYPRFNRRTIVQRVSALVILLLLPLHVKTFEVLRGGAAPAGVIAAELVFFAAVTVHVGTSFSRGLISLGRLDTPERQKRVDAAVWAALGILMLLAAAAVVRTQLVMFGR